MDAPQQRAPKIHQPRNCRSCLGELIQIDGSDHAWFEDRAPACTLLVFVDDATSRLMQLHFVPTESAFAYFETTRSYLEEHGKPVAFYSDKAAIFRSARDSTDFGRGTTQYGRALFELNIVIAKRNQLLQVIDRSIVVRLIQRHARVHPKPVRLESTGSQSASCRV